MTGKLKKSIWLLVISLPAVTLFGPFLSLPGISVSLWQAVFAVLVVLGLCYLAVRRPARPFGSSANYALFYIVMLIYAGISLLWVRNFGVSLYSFYYQVFGTGIVLFIAAGVSENHSLHRLLDLLTVCVLLLLAVGLVEIFTGYYLFSPSNPQLYWKNDFGLYFPYASFANTNDYSTFITLFLPFAAYNTALKLKGIVGKLLAAVLCAAGLFALVNANARACLIAVVVLCAAFTVAISFKHALRRYLLPVFAVAGAAVIAFAAFVVKSGVLSELTGKLTMQDNSVSERWTLTLASFKMLAAYHFLGVGVGNSVTLAPYYSALLRPANLHNMTLQILTEYGIIIFAFYAAALIALAVRFFRFDPAGVKNSILGSICFATVCAYPVAGIASSDTTHLTPVWLLPGIWLACVRIFSTQKAEPAGRPSPGCGKKLLFISFIDFGDMSSGSSVRPQRMYEAFRELGYDIDLLSGLQNRKLERLKNVYKKYRSLHKNGLPDFCYVEPPSGPFFNLCDHLLLIWLKKKGVPVGLFYRDAYWRFADWWPVSGLKRFFLILMHRFDLFVIKRTCRIVFFPTLSMAELFKLPKKDVLPPAGFDSVAPPHELSHRALYVGGVSKNYGTDILLKAFEIVNEREKRDIKLLLVCREAEESNFFDGYRGRAWLEIAHASGDAQLAPIYAACDIAVYPSRRDFYMDFCMPVKLFEYLSRALPVVCTSCREASRFVEKNGVGLVALDNPESLAEKVMFLYDNPRLIGELREKCIEALRGGNLWVHRAQKAAEEIMG